jgi:mTERF domain-containing protein
MLLHYPELFLKSLNSLELKMKYLEKRWKMKFEKDPSFPGILCFNYNETIRPRGELMLKVIF